MISDHAAVAVTNEEGHTTAIRQPFTTSPVYLFLEDGIPVRATGFFNHNALYEVNIPLAGGIEVVRGPATALYGSDAIGGVINILSRAPVAQRHGEARAELGAFGTWRGLLSVGEAIDDSGAIEADLNVTHTDGWREKTGYDRTSLNLRFDQPLAPGVTLKTIAGFSKVDQETGANSPLPLRDYLENPTRNLMPIAFRNVSATRISLEYEHVLGPSLFSLIPTSVTMAAHQLVLRFEHEWIGGLLPFQEFSPLRVSPQRAASCGASSCVVRLSATRLARSEIAVYPRQVDDPSLRSRGPASRGCARALPG